MRKITICAGAAAFALSLLTAGGAMSANGPHVLFVDRQKIMNSSRLGVDIKRQIMAYENKTNADLGPESTALQNEEQALQQQTASMTADQRAKKSQALQAKQAAFRLKVQDQQSLIQGGEMTARKFYMGQVGDAIHAVMVERGADVVLEKAAVLDSVNGLDITQDVIQRLDKKASSFKVPLVKPSQDEMMPMLH